MATTFKHVHVC